MCLPTCLPIRRGLCCTSRTAAWGRNRAPASPPPTEWTGGQPHCIASTHPRMMRTGGRAETHWVCGKDSPHLRQSHRPFNKLDLCSTAFCKLKMDLLYFSPCLCFKSIRWFFEEEKPKITTKIMPKGCRYLCLSPDCHYLLSAKSFKGMCIS